jgi:mutator protein MutT
VSVGEDLPPLHDVVAAAIVRAGACLLGLRPPGSRSGGLWEFPGGKVDPAESHEAALARELREELGVEAAVGRRLGSSEHAYPHATVRLHLYACEITGEPAPLFHAALRWVPLDELREAELTPASGKLLERLPPAGLELV